VCYTIIVPREQEEPTGRAADRQQLPPCVTALKKINRGLTSKSPYDIIDTSKEERNKKNEYNL
jgi:hypothetical protein